jgi:hypothetical protein
MRHLRSTLTTFALAALVTAAGASSASATMLVGVESNGEFTNPNRTPAQQLAALDTAKSAGVQIIRANVSWKDIAANCAGQTVDQLAAFTNPCYSWTNLDALVQGAHARGIQLVVSVTRVPTWVNSNDDPYFVGSSSAQFTRFVNNYRSFMSAIGRRYNASSSVGIITKWTIWSEPNSGTFWKPMNTVAEQSIAPVRYAILYAAAAPALHFANPTALIAVGPTGPRSTIRPISFLKVLQPQLLRRLPGATLTIKRRYLNAWAHNPYAGSGAAPNVAFLKSPAVGIGNISDLLHQLDAQAITKGLPVWATEFGYETNPPDNIFGISTGRQGPYLAQALDILDSKARIAMAINYQLTDASDLADFQSGIFFANGAAKPSLTYFQRPLSSNINSMRKASPVVIWGRSLLSPRTGRLAYSFNGGRTWNLLPTTGRRSDGSQRITLRVNRTIKIRVQDALGHGAEKVILVR